MMIYSGGTEKEKVVRRTSVLLRAFTRITRRIYEVQYLIRYCLNPDHPVNPIKSPDTAETTGTTKQHAALRNANCLIRSALALWGRLHDSPMHDMAVDHSLQYYNNPAQLLRHLRVGQNLCNRAYW